MRHGVAEPGHLGGAGPSRIPQTPASTERGSHAEPCPFSRHYRMDAQVFSTEDPARLLSIERVSAVPGGVANPSRPTKKTRTPARNLRIRFTLQMSVSGAFTCANTSRKKLIIYGKLKAEGVCRRHSHLCSSACRDPSRRKKKGSTAVRIPVSRAATTRSLSAAFLWGYSIWGARFIPSTREKHARNQLLTT